VEGKVDARMDLFAFGCVLYEMLTGRRAFTGETGASLMSAILRRSRPTSPRSCPRRRLPSIASSNAACRRIGALGPNSARDVAKDLRSILAGFSRIARIDLSPVRIPSSTRASAQQLVLAVLRAPALVVSQSVISSTNRDTPEEEDTHENINTSLPAGCIVRRVLASAIQDRESARRCYLCLHEQ
jgi:serine/threonine protein kinase